LRVQYLQSNNSEKIFTDLLIGAKKDHFGDNFTLIDWENKNLTILKSMKYHSKGQYENLVIGWMLEA